MERYFSHHEKLLKQNIFLRFFFYKNSRKDRLQALIVNSFARNVGYSHFHLLHPFSSVANRMKKTKRRRFADLRRKCRENTVSRLRKSLGRFVSRVRYGQKIRENIVHLGAANCFVCNLRRDGAKFSNKTVRLSSCLAGWRNKTLELQSVPAYKNCDVSAPFIKSPFPAGKTRRGTRRTRLSRVLFREFAL